MDLTRDDSQFIKNHPLQELIIQLILNNLSELEKSVTIKYKNETYLCDVFISITKTSEIEDLTPQ